MLHIVLFFLFPLIFALIPFQPCSPSPSITFRGANDVTRSRAETPALIVFAPLQCTTCYNYLRRLNDLASTRAYRIYVVAPDFESNHIIQRTVSAFPHLQIDRAGEGWPRLSAKDFDAIVLDPCSRITETLQLPSSDVTSHPAIQNALNAASTKCEGKMKSCSNKKKVNAWIKEKEQQEHIRRSQNPNQNPQNYQYQNTEYRNHLQNQRQNNNRNQNPQNPTSYQNNYYQPNQQNHYNQNQHQSNYQNPHQNRNQNNYNNYQNQINQNYYTTPPAQYHPQNQPIPTERATTTSTTSNPASDYDYYSSDDDVAVTTPYVQTQIPRPPDSHSNAGWPTHTPFQLQQSYPNQWNSQYPFSNQQQSQKGGSPLTMDANLPCSAFTDDICHQQREQMGSLVSKCCNKGVYLTDVCIQGKCSNSTTQLCCFQKFLQAKYSCCNDPAQDEGAPKLTNKFNKCCYSHFITDDPCCPVHAARRYWSTAYEVCMPTVTVDFSPVRFEVHFTEGVRVLDLSVDRQWEFNCTYGTKQPQFAYLPSETIFVASDSARGH